MTLATAEDDSATAANASATVAEDPLPAVPGAGKLCSAFPETGTLLPSLTVARISCPPFSRAGALLPSLPPAGTLPPAFLETGTLFLQAGKVPPAFVGVDPSLTVARISFTLVSRVGRLLPSLPPAGKMLPAFVGAGNSV